MSMADFFRARLFSLKMALPGKLQVKLAGGRALVMHGRTLDPSIQLLAHMSSGQPALSALPIDVARAAAAAGYAMLSGPVRKTGAVRDCHIPGSGGDIAVRIFTPTVFAQEPACVLYFHPGGWVIGDLDTGNSFCAELCERAGVPVVAVDYRLAPEHKFPAAVEDAMSAYGWMLANAAQLGSQSDKVVVAGESAGANLAAVVCQLAKAKGLQQPHCQFLISPVTDVSNRSASYSDFASAFPLNADLMEWFISTYLGDNTNALDERASPLLASDLENLASAVVVTAGFDPLVDEGEAYADRLRSAGVRVEYHCEEASGHGITTLTGLSRSCARANNRVIEILVNFLKTG